MYQLTIHTPAVNKFVDTSLHFVGPGGRMAENRVKDQWIAGSNPLTDQGTCDRFITENNILPVQFDDNILAYYHIFIIRYIS